MRRTEAVRTAATASMTVAAVIGFLRVFDPPSALIPLVAIALVGHTAAATTRRLPTAVGWFVMLALGFLVCTDIAHWADTTWGIPTSATFEAIRSSFDTAIETLRNESAPVATSSGLTMIVGGAIWVAAWSTDRLAFRYRAPIEAVVPSLTIFIVVTALSSGAYRWSTIGIYAAAVTFHLLTARHLSNASIQDARSNHSAWRPIIRGSSMAACALVIGLGAAARVPALQLDGALPLRPDNAIVVSSPLIDMRKNLGPRSDQVMFTVAANGEHYWRLTALSDFDGSVWSPRAATDLQPADTQLTDPMITRTPPNVASATFTIGQLRGKFAPAPFVPVALSDLRRSSGEDQPKLVWQHDTASLIASRRTGDVEGLVYRTDSVVPRDDGGLDPGPTARRHIEDTALPRSLEDALRPLANRIVKQAGAQTPSEKARAIQDFFSAENGFRYDLDVAPARDGTGDESTSAILAFLDPHGGRRGFCVQYAGTFAALARSIGLPTRLAVGFIPGESRRELTHDFTFTVRGRDAHTWPEVYIEGAGWIPFEPTPGRGNPDAEDWTGRATVLTDASDDDTASATSVVTPTTNPDRATPSSTSQPGAPTPSVASPSPTTTSDHPSGGGSPRAPLVGLGLVALAVGIGPGLRAIRGRRRQRWADTPARRVRVAWTDTLDVWSRLDVTRAPTDTDRDLGDRIADRVTALEGPSETVASARRLARLAGASAWNALGVSSQDEREARRAAASLTRLAQAHQSTGARVLRFFDPRYRGGD